MNLQYSFASSVSFILTVAVADPTLIPSDVTSSISYSFSNKLETDTLFMSTLLFPL